MTDYSYGQGSNWYDREFSYWDDNLLPHPRQVMQFLQSDVSGNLSVVVARMGISGVERQTDAEMIIQTFLYESGDSELMEKYGL